MSYETSYSEMCEEGLKCCKDDERSLVRRWAYWASNDEIRREYTHDGELRKQFVPLDKNAMQRGDDGVGVRRIIEAIDGDSESNRVERIRAFFAYLKAHRPKQWEVLKAIIRTKGNREAALLMLGINKKLYLQHIFLLVKLTFHRLCKCGDM